MLALPAGKGSGWLCYPGKLKHEPLANQAHGFAIR